jgi:sporulation protein YlmC with PRC-barrel domain
MRPPFYLKKFQMAASVAICVLPLAGDMRRQLLHVTRMAWRLLFIGHDAKPLRLEPSMKTLYCIVLVAVCMILPALASFQGIKANGDVRQSTNAAQKQDKNQDMYRGSKVIGADIRDPPGKKLGEIKDILLDSERGEVAFLVASFGGAMGLPGRKYHAIPWKALQLGDDGKHYVLYADRETISKAPAFDQKKWPDPADRKWSTEVDRYWTRMVGHAPSGGITTSSGASSSGPIRDRSNENGRQPSP